MNCPCDLTSRRLDASDVALPFERAFHLDTEVDIHRLVPTFWVVIEEQVVSGAQFAIRFQERPHSIERPLPYSGDIADGHRGPDCCHQLCLRSFHHNIVFHGHGPSARARRSTAFSISPWENLERRGIQRLRWAKDNRSPNCRRDPVRAVRLFSAHSHAIISDHGNALNLRANFFWTRSETARSSIKVIR